MELLSIASFRAMVIALLCFNPIFASETRLWEAMGENERALFLLSESVSDQEKIDLLQQTTAGAIVAFAVNYSVLSFSIANILYSTEFIETGMRTGAISLHQLAGFCLNAIEDLDVVTNLTSNRDEVMDRMERILRDFVVLRIRNLLLDQRLSDEVLSRLTTIAVPKRIKIKSHMKRYQLLPKQSLVTRTVLACVDIFDFLVVRRNSVFGSFKTN